MNAFDQLDALTAQAPAGAPGGASGGASAAPEAPSEFGKGLRSGGLGMASQLHSFAGGIGAAGGYDDFALRQNAQAADLTARAHAAAPRVSSYKDVLKDPTLNNAGDYLAGLAGQAIPSAAVGVGAGAVAALTRGKVNPLLLATAAQLPLEAGDVLARQQADAGARARDPGTNLREAMLLGGASAFGQNIVPAAFGGKLMGTAAHGVEGAALREGVRDSSLLGGMAKGAAGDAITQGAAGAGGEILKQKGVNRDAPVDWEAAKEAGVGGAIIGAPFGAAGHLADSAHAAPGNFVDGITGGVKNAVGSVADAVGSAKDAVTGAVAGAEPRSSHSPQEVADWHSAIQAGTTDATVAGTIGERSDAAKTSFNNIMADPDVPAAVKEQAKAYRQNPGDKTAQAWAQSAEKVADSARDYKASMAESDARPDTIGDLNSAVNEDTNAATVAAGGNVGTDAENAAFAGATDPVSLRQHADAAFKRTADWATSTAKNLSDRADISPETRDRLSKVASGVGDAADAAWVATQSTALKAKDSVVGAAKSVLKAIGDPRDDLSAGAKRSDDLSGVRATIMEKLAPHVPPELLSDPVARIHVADAVRAFIGAASSNDIVKVNKATEGMRSILGDKTEDVLGDVYKAIGAADPAERDRFALTMREMKSDNVRAKSLMTVLNVNLPDHVALSDSSLTKLSDTLKRWSTGRDVQGMTPNEAMLHHEAVREKINELYGPKADAVFKALEGHAAAEESVPGEARRAPKSSDDATTGGDASTEAGAEHGELTGQSTQAEYYGGGKDRQAGALMQSPEAYRAKFPEFEGATEKLIKKLQAAHPDKDVRFISERERNVREDVKGGATDHGFVVVEGLKDRDQISSRDLDNMRLDSDKYSRSPSRLEIGTEGMRSVLVDAVKLTGHFLKNMEKGDGQPDIVRAGRAFMEGVSALQAEHGAFELHDSTVIDKKGTTFGQAKEALRKVDTATMSTGHNEPGSASDRLATIDKKVNKLELKMLDLVEKVSASDSRKELMGTLRGKWEEARAQREEAWTAVSAEREMERTGRTEPSKDDQIHMAAATQSSDALTSRSNMDGTAKAAPSAKVDLDTKPTMNAIRKLGGDGTAIGRKIADRATKLLDNVAVMSRADQERLLGLKDAKNDKRVLGISGLSPSETAAVVNDLARKYKDVLAAPKGEVAKGAKNDPASGRPLDRQNSPGVDAQGRVTGGSESPEMTIKKFRDAQEEAAMKPLGGETAAERAQREQFGSNPSPKAEAAKKAALLQAASSSEPALLKELRTTDNAKGLQRTVDELSKNAPDSKALEVANDRIDALVQNPDVAYSLAAVHSKESVDKTAQGPTNRAEARAHLDKTLGDSVRSVLDAAIGHAGEYIHAEKLIRISVHALNPLSVAYHESLHAFVAQLRDWGLHDVSKVLLKAANEDYAIKQLNEHFKDQPEVLKQIAGDAEERAAYMYQLYQQGKFKVGPEAKGVFGKIADFIRGALGIWSNDERAIHIMDHFSSGEYAKSIGKPNEIFAKTMEGGRNKAVDMLASMAEPFVNMGEHVFAAGQAQLRDMGNSHISKITDLVKPLHTDSGKDTGFLAAARNERAAVMNKLSGAMDGLSKEHTAQALEQLQTGTKAEASEARFAAFAVKRALRGVFDYMGKAGLDVGDLGKDYFPRVWDANAISKSQDQFKLMLERNGVADSEATMKRIIANDGNNFDVDTRMPGFQSGKERVLSQISGTDASPFQNKNMLDTLNSYVGQATRRAEFARRFGADGKGLDKMMVDAKANGATKDQLQTVEKYMKGVTGTLGDGINPTARRMIGNMIVYQNLRLLPLAVFSSMPDALGIVVRGGSVSNAFSTFKRGFREMAKNFQSYDPTAPKDWRTKAAETLGVIENAMLTHAIGASYTQGMVSETGRAVNDTLFRFNLMEQYNNSMRAGATGAAIHFIQEHGGEGAGKHSARYLSELGLSKSDVKLDSRGHLMIDEASGLSPEAAVKMRDAVNKWVDGAVLRPDAADKPIWMNDPHFALFAHLKQFMYSFHHTVLTRVAHEANHGNYTPALALASYVPMMIAADAAKGLIQGGGSTPDWKDGWGPGDYLWNGLQRAGLFGVGQTAIDAAADVHRGGSGFGALTGPTVEQLTDLVKTVGGSERAGTFALHSMPANALYGSMFKGAKGAADPMFAD